LIGHKLDYEGEDLFTPEIDNEIDLLKGRVNTVMDLTSIINLKFKKQFEWYIIHYRMQKIMRETYGKPHEDAYKFVSLANQDVKENGGYFKVELGVENRFEKAIYLSKTMLDYSDKFLDLVLVDATYKRNRFNLPLVSLIGVNNYGKNILLAFALLTDETASSYTWVFQKLKEAWNQNTVKTFICDECPSINQGLYF